MSKTIVKNLNKIYPNGFQALHNINLEIEDGEFIVFVGPSGCGKSTLLRVIAGLEDISEGEIYIDGKFVNDVDPKDRNVAMVFQDYALYPHMSVKQNLEFSLKIRKYDKKAIDKKVEEVAGILDIKNLLDRKPRALSGGQRQRVALGRAMVRDPKLFLFDEPLSNLDAKLRGTMRAEIIKLHQKMKVNGTSFIYVTHDQIEAMTMADRIAVLKNGVIQQIGKPEELYDDPENIFVAGFIGQPGMNFLETEKRAGNLYIAGTDFILQKNISQNSKIIAGIRPEKIKIGSGISLKVNYTELTGSEMYVYTEIEKSAIVIKLNERRNFSIGEEIKADMDLKDILYFDEKSGERLKF